MLLLLAVLSPVPPFRVSLFRMNATGVCQAADRPLRTINQLSDLNESTVGTLVGTYVDLEVESALDYVTILYFDNYDEMEKALIDGTIDALWSDEPIMQNRANADPRLRVLRESIATSNYGFAFRNSDSSLLQQVDAIIREFLKNGEMDRLKKKWVEENNGDDDSITMPQARMHDKALRFGTTHVMPPFTFLDAHGTPAGLEIDLAKMIAQRLNRPLVIEMMNFSDLISALLTGKVDMIGSAIAITEEREKLISFTTSYFAADVVALVRK